jgi:hypothetical protein
VITISSPWRARSMRAANSFSASMSEIVVMAQQ